MANNIPPQLGLKLGSGVTSRQGFGIGARVILQVLVVEDSHGRLRKCHLDNQYEVTPYTWVQPVLTIAYRFLQSKCKPSSVSSLRPHRQVCVSPF